MSKETKSVTVIFRVTKKEKEHIRDMTLKHGFKSITDYLRSILMK